jgi:60 kDa SS-A/Ro ribonucleoprotein
MASKNLFSSLVGKLVPRADTINEAGGVAHRFDPKHALAQYAATGCLGSTFYATDREQLDAVLAMAMEVEPLFLAKVAVYARQQGRMKDMPALLCAVLSVRSPKLLAAVFDRVVDDPKSLRTFVQILRSGAVGRKSLGTRPKKLVSGWLSARTDAALFAGSVGNDPSLADVIKMVHPKPATPERSALFGYLLGKPYELEKLPENAQKFEAFKRERSGAVPDVPFQMLTALDLGKREWTAIALRASWQTVRMNLNTFARHGVFTDDAVAKQVAERLRDESEVRRARALPYQLLMAHRHLDEGVPRVVREALHDAMESATANVPRLEGKVWVCTDVSGSMSSPVTGARGTATTKVRCVDVAALVAAALLRKNPDLTVLPFDTEVRSVGISARDSVLTNAERLASVGGGGTAISAPLRKLNGERAAGDLVLFISDNESWAETRRGPSTATMIEWTRFKQRNPQAKLICLDIQPYAHTQAPDRADILNVGGFSDQVFEVVQAFHESEGARHWVDVIEQVEIAAVSA